MKRKDSALEKAAMRYWNSLRKRGLASEYVYRAYIAGWKARARHAKKRRRK